MSNSEYSITGWDEEDFEESEDLQDRLHGISEGIRQKETNDFLNRTGL